MVDLLQNKSINLVTGRKVLQLVIDGDSRTPYLIVQENKWFQISDEEQIRKICVEVVNSNPKLVQKYKSGKVKFFGAFMGEVAKKTKQKGNMVLAEKILKELLEKNQ
ncbi:hypothetical protein J437_LFUL006493 [Ladona fulva]|uniref:Asn/Gln amidotransferase domain-containing protein n=1 Tax=Ladona fulva TaxID=123851 RepID=A0A8K0NX53_LADFU|nr:hypothetical protein J437_LFUL006493 [Ladona fulva]